MQAVFDDDVPAVPDAGKKTLHLRCGDDIRGGLAEAGLEGEFGTFAYPFVHGPAPTGDDRATFIETGTRFLVDSGFAESEVETQRRLIEEFLLLDASVGIERVCLWFEHDAYDILCLTFLLDWYAKNGAPDDLRFVCCDSHPTVEQFHGLGQLSPGALRNIWSQFLPVTPEILRFGSRCWTAFTGVDPNALWQIAVKGTPELPAAEDAFRRQLKELPHEFSGLSFTEELMLRILQDHGSITAAGLFRRYTIEYEPLVFMGDLGFRQCVLIPMSTGTTPAITMTTSEEDDNWWRSTTVELTACGAALLAGDADWLNIAAVDRWVGGVRVKSGASGWRRCAKTGAPVEI
jgi:hypothetical protein